MDIKDTDIGRLWSTHYPKRKKRLGFSLFCLSIAHAIRNIAQNNRCGGVTERLRSALTSLDVPEDEFFQFTGQPTALPIQKPRAVPSIHCR
jgi:hypothetical protein